MRERHEEKSWEQKQANRDGYKKKCPKEQHESEWVRSRDKKVGKRMHKNKRWNQVTMRNVRRKDTIRVMNQKTRWKQVTMRKVQGMPHERKASHNEKNSKELMINKKLTKGVSWWAYIWCKCDTYHIMEPQYHTIQDKVMANVATNLGIVLSIWCLTDVVKSRLLLKYFNILLFIWT